MNRKQKDNAAKKLTAAGFQPWQVKAWHPWAKGQGKRWRRATKKVFGVKIS